MTERPTLTSAAPVLEVRDLDAALERFSRLGFAVHAYDGLERYGFVERDGVAMHLTERPDHEPTRDGAQVYLYVSDADALHAEWRAAGVAFRLTEPADTPYGLREFHLVDVDGTLLRAGSPLLHP